MEQRSIPGLSSHAHRIQGRHAWPGPRLPGRPLVRGFGSTQVTVKCCNHRQFRMQLRSEQCEEMHSREAGRRANRSPKVGALRLRLLAIVLWREPAANCVDSSID